MAFETPWRWLRRPDSGGEYLALATYLPIGRWSALPAFGRYTYGVTRQLSRSPGLVGYSLRARLRVRLFWTLTLWEDENSLAQFVRAEPHRDAMRWLIAAGVTGFFTTRWEANGQPSWDEALARLDVHRGQA